MRDRRRRDVEKRSNRKQFSNVWSMWRDSLSPFFNFILSSPYRMMRVFSILLSLRKNERFDGERKENLFPCVSSTEESWMREGFKTHLSPYLLEWYNLFVRARKKSETLTVRGKERLHSSDPLLNQIWHQEVSRKGEEQGISRWEDGRSGSDERKSKCVSVENPSFPPSTLFYRSPIKFMVKVMREGDWKSGFVFKSVDRVSLSYHYAFHSSSSFSSQHHLLPNISLPRHSFTHSFNGSHLFIHSFIASPFFPSTRPSFREQRSILSKSFFKKRIHLFHHSHSLSHPPSILSQYMLHISPSSITDHQQFIFWRTAEKVYQKVNEKKWNTRHSRSTFLLDQSSRPPAKFSSSEKVSLNPGYN